MKKNMSLQFPASPWLIAKNLNSQRKVERHPVTNIRASGVCGDHVEPVEELACERGHLTNTRLQSEFPNSSELSPDFRIGHAQMFLKSSIEIRIADVSRGKTEFWGKLISEKKSSAILTTLDAKST